MDYRYRWLVSHWTFDVDGSDAADNFAATFVNGATVTNASDEFKIGGGAVSLDGADDYVVVEGICAELAGSDFTITMWIRSEMDDFNAFFASFNTVNSDNKLMLGQQSSSETLSISDNGWHDSGTVVFDGGWHHAGFVLADSADEVLLYVDGELALSHTTTNSIASDDLFSLGQEYDAGKAASDLFEGQLDDIRVYKRKLSLEEIAELIE